MNRGTPVARLVGSSLLAVLAVAAAVFSAMTLLAALVTGPLSAAPGGAAPTAALVVGALGMAYAAMTGYAARATWRGRPVGQMLGLTAAFIAVLAATATLLTGEFIESTGLLYVAIGLGGVTAVALAVPGLRARMS